MDNECIVRMQLEKMIHNLLHLGFRQFNSFCSIQFFTHTNIRSQPSGPIAHRCISDKRDPIVRECILRVVKAQRVIGYRAAHANAVRVDLCA